MIMTNSRSFVALEIYHFSRLTKGGVEKYKHGMGWSLGGSSQGEWKLVRKFSLPFQVTGH